MATVWQPQAVYACLIPDMEINRPEMLVYRESYEESGIHAITSIPIKLTTVDDREYVLSLGNRKLSGTMLIFNLPSIMSCPGAKECKTYCYTKFMETIKAVKRARLQNYKMTEGKYFVNDMCTVIRRVLEKYPYIQYLRIHESGDFYSPSYAQKWAKIMSWAKTEHPKLIFYAYTKSAFVKNVAFPDNLRLWYSTGGLFDKDYPADANKVIVVPHDANKVELRKLGIYFCPGGHKMNGGWYVCGRDCDYCMSVVGNKNKYVGFELH